MSVNRQKAERYLQDRQKRKDSQYKDRMYEVRQQTYCERRKTHRHGKQYRRIESRAYLQSQIKRRQTTEQCRKDDTQNEVDKSRKSRFKLLYGGNDVRSDSEVFMRQFDRMAQKTPLTDQIYG